MKAPLRPADDLGGSWNWVLLYGRMTDASLVDVLAFNYAWDEAKLFSGEIGYALKEDNPFVRLLYRLHHRSGVFGLMQNDNAGNTAIQIGIRHYFK